MSCITLLHVAYSVLTFGKEMTSNGKNFTCFDGLSSANNSVVMNFRFTAEARFLPRLFQTWFLPSRNYKALFLPGAFPGEIRIFKNVP